MKAFDILSVESYAGDLLRAMIATNFPAAETAFPRIINDLHRIDVERIFDSEVF